MDGDTYALPSVVPLGNRNRVAKSGQEKRLVANQLPHPILLYDYQMHRVLAACLLVRCLHFANSASNATFIHGGAHILDKAYVVNPDDFAFQSAVFRLQPSVEQDIRLSYTQQGVCLNSCFNDFAGCLWRVMRFRTSEVNEILVGSGHVFQKRSSTDVILGLVPEEIDEPLASPADLELAVDEVFQRGSNS